MTVERIQVYDALNTKKLITLPVSSGTRVKQICEKLDPTYKKQDKTLYLEDLELLWDWDIRYLEEHHHLKNGQKFAFLIRTYDLEQTCRVLQLEEEEVRELIAQKKVKAFNRGGKPCFRKVDVDELRDSMMECPTMLLPNSQAKLEALLASQEEQEQLLKIFDSTNGTSKELPFDPDKTIGEYCLEVNPDSEKEDMTLFQENNELDWNRLLSDLADAGEVSLEKRFALKFRFYTRKEALEKLGISEAILKRRVQLKELRAYSKKGEWVFKKREIDSLTISRY